MGGQREDRNQRERGTRVPAGRALHHRSVPPLPRPARKQVQRCGLPGPGRVHPGQAAGRQPAEGGASAAMGVAAALTPARERVPGTRSSTRPCAGPEARRAHTHTHVHTHTQRTHTHSNSAAGACHAPRAEQPPDPGPGARAAAVCCCRVPA